MRLVGHDLVVSRFTTRKVAMLLARLALACGRPQSRDELVELLWPEADPDLGRRSLRVALTHLRRELEIPGIHARGQVLMADRQSVVLLPTAISTDALAFENAVSIAARHAGTGGEAGALDLAVSLYGGPFMPGFYDDWVLTERDRLESVFVATARRAACALREAGALDEAIRVARRAIGADPSSEECHVLLIELLLETGQAAAAAAQCREAERLVFAELDDPVSDEFRLVAQRATAARGAVEPPIGAPAKAPSSAGPDANAPRAGGRQPAGDLPAPSSRTFGREDEVARLVRMLDPAEAATNRAMTAGRLVTLTGMAGVGKTRLAQDAAWQLVDAYRARVCFVPLADVSDASLIGHRIAQYLGATSTNQSEALAAVIDSIGAEPLLLVLDNAEHLAPAVSSIVVSLLRSAPAIRMVVTSRRRLAVPGEAVMAVRPLALPPQGAAPESARYYPAVRLFENRACAADPHFEVSASNVADIASLCAHLDGLPLAIELAAARVAVLPPREMLARISERFELLSDAKHRVPAHQRSLWAAIQWSDLLLPPAVQRYLASVSVFRGGWTIEAAASVGSEPQSLDYTARLCECSLAQAMGGLDHARFALPETIREYAARRLRGDGKRRAQARHAAYFLRFVLRNAPRALTDPAPARALDAEAGNIRAALEWLAANGRTHALVRMTAALVDYWDIRGMARESIRWARWGAGHMERLGPRLGYQALRAAGRLATLLCEFAEAEEYCHRALALARLPKAGVIEAAPLIALAHLQHMRGDYAKSVLAAERARERAAEARSAGHEAAALQQLAQALAAFGDFRRSAEQAEEALAIQRQIGQQRGIADAALLLAETLLNVGQLSAAEPLLAEVERICDSLGDRPGLASALRGQSALAVWRGRYARAGALLDRSEALWAAYGAPEPLADILLRRSELARQTGAYGLADGMAAKALEAWRQRGHRRWTALALCQVSAVCLSTGRPEEARDRADEALALLADDPAPWVLHTPQYHLGRAHLALGDAELSARLLTASLNTRGTAGLRLRAAEGCEALALAESALGRHEHAAELLGCAEATRAALGAPVPPLSAHALEDLASRLSGALGDAAWAHARGRGCHAADRRSSALLADPARAE